jgi:hypothetical protein
MDEQPRGTMTMNGAMGRKALSLVGLAAVLASAYWFDLHVMIPMRRTAGNTFDPAPDAWTELAARIAIALAVLGLVWLLFRWAPPSRVVGAVYLVIGFALAAAWPIAVGFFMNRGLSLPIFDQLDLWGLLGQGGLLDLVAPFLVAIGLLRLLLPLPRGLRRSRARVPVSEAPASIPRPSP